jgi:hypothetical protein
MDPYLINSAGGTAPESDGGTTTVVSNPPKPPTTNTVPNTTTNTKKVVYQTAAKDTAVKPASDPSQFPAYDDTGNLQPGFKINEETGQTYYAGVSPPTKDPYGLLAAEDEAIAQSDAAAYTSASVGPRDPYGLLAAEDEAIAQSDAAAFASASVGPRDPYGLLAAEDAALAEQAAARGDAEAFNHLSTTPVNVNDPYSGLTPDQIKKLGGADPTDPYIRARLGIPQLPGSTLNVTPGFGFGNLTTNLPSIDGALGTIKGLFGGLLGGGAGGGSGLSSLFTNFASTVGGLFGGTPTASTTAATTGSGTAALVASVGPATNLTKVDATTTEGFGVQAPVDPTTLEGFGVQAPVDPTTLEGYGIQATVDPTTLEGYGVPATTDNTTLNADQADAFYNGTGTPTTAQVQAQDQQTAADAAKLYPGTQNKALLNIDKGYAAIEENTAGIANAEKIVAANNAELADPNISDARRAELEANNDAQQQYIQVATENTAIQQNVIEQNANVYAAGGGNEGDGLKTTPVDPTTLEGYGVQAPVDPTTLEGFGVQAPVDPTTLEGYGIQATVDPTTLEGFGVQAPVDPTTLEGYGIQATVDPTTLEGFGVPGPAPVDANNSGEGFGNVYPDGFGGFVNGDGQPVDANGSLIPTGDNVTQSAGLVDPGTGGEGFSLTPDGNGGYTDAAGNPVDQYGMPIEAVPPTTYPPADVLSDEDAALYDELAARPDRNAAINTDQASALVDQEQGSQEAAMKSMAQKQATIQARYKQPGNTDWRVRLSLGPKANYLYNAEDPGILAPLRAGSGTDGVIFPYTPSITTTYSANYEQYDLVHSNYRGLFYKNSRVGDIQIRGTFTAQNTTEANYLLAVIHFFRSATKMFYGQDPQRGTPPPICLLNGLGGYQFSDHPVVISSFNYTLPNDVDYIRTTNPNNFGLNLNNRYNPAGASLPAGGSLSGLNRLVNALLPKGAQPPTPAPNTVVGSVTNNTPASYVPTKMEIDITLIPAQTRAQISKQFSLAGFANGDLLKGGFW